MKRADYERQKHNKKKRERDLQEKKQHRKSLISYYLVLGAIFLLIITIILAFTIKTENPILLMVAWWILFDGLCGKNRYNIKKLKRMILIPVIEVFLGIIIFSLWIIVWIIGNPDTVSFLNKYETGLIIIFLIFSGLINGVSLYYYNWLSKK